MNNLTTISQLIDVRSFNNCTKTAFCYSSLKSKDSSEELRAPFFVNSKSFFSPNERKCNARARKTRREREEQKCAPRRENGFFSFSPPDEKGNERAVWLREKGRSRVEDVRAALLLQ